MKNRRRTTYHRPIIWISLGVMHKQSSAMGQTSKALRLQRHLTRQVKSLWFTLPQSKRQNSGQALWVSTQTMQSYLLAAFPMITISVCCLSWFKLGAERLMSHFLELRWETLELKLATTQLTMVTYSWTKSEYQGRHNFHDSLRLQLRATLILRVTYVFFTLSWWRLDCNFSDWVLLQFNVKLKWLSAMLYADGNSPIRQELKRNESFLTTRYIPIS